MAVKIKKINIQKFRGIPELELLLEGKSLLLKGDNGTGKSSIVDAIEFFFTGEVSHLKGSRGLSIGKHGPHINYKKEDVNIEITFQDNTRLNRTYSNVPALKHHLGSYFDVAQKGQFILRRSQILEFVISAPADRFKAIGNLMGIDPLDKIELEMMRLRDRLQGDANSKKEIISSSLKGISEILEKKIEKIDEILIVLNNKLQKIKFPSIKSFEDVDQYIENRFKNFLSREEISENTIIFNQVISEIKSYSLIKDLKQEFNKFEKLKNKLSEIQIETNLSLIKVLNKGKNIIEQEKYERCPLCEQKIERDILLEKIKERLRNLQLFSSEASKLRSISSSISNFLKNQINQLEKMTSQIDGKSDFKNEKVRLEEFILFLKQFIQKLIDIEMTKEIPIEEYKNRADEVNLILKNLSKKSNQLVLSTELTKEEKTILDCFNLIINVKSKALDLIKLNSEYNLILHYSKIAELIYTTFSEVKKKKIQEIYGTIEDDICKFYTMIHLDDPHKNIELCIDPKKRASTLLTMESFGLKNMDPRALTSEGHLDSLGVCVFLAFIKKFNQSCPLIILDDIVTTVDANHRERIAKLLLEVFNEDQLIITTHDGIWYDQLRSYQRTCKMDFKNLIIVDWDIDIGPKIIPYKLRWEKIEKKIDLGDKASAGNEARSYMEWILKEVCEKMQVQLPYKKNGKYSQIELLNPAEKRLKKLLSNLEDDHKLKNGIIEGFNKLRSSSFIANWLSHDNPEIEMLSLQEVKNYCEAVRELHIAFLCPTCEHFIIHDQNLKRIMCSNKRCNNPLTEVIK